MATEGNPTVIIHETLSGVIIHITPLSIFTIKALDSKADSQFPYPDPVPFQVASETFASGFIPASENPEYKTLCEAVDNEREEWKANAILELCCEFPKWETRNDMIAHFRPRLEEMRKFIDLGTDEWQNVLQHCVFTGTSAVYSNGKEVRVVERLMVVHLAKQNGNIPLTPAEVVDGLKFFRVEVSRNGTGRMAGQARGLEKQNSN